MAAMLASAQGTKHALERLFHQKQEISIGRNPSNTIVLNATISPEKLIPDSLVLQLSRHHAKLTVKDGELQIMDNGTLNGTFINNLRIPAKTWRVLKNGDVISLGGTNPLELNGVVEDNPWTFKVKRPEEFLARYIAPSSLPNAETQSQGGSIRASGGRVREVYSFSAGEGVQPTKNAPPQQRPPPQNAAPAGPEVIDLTLLEDSPPRAVVPPRPKSASRKSSKSASHDRDSKRARPASAASIPSQPAAAPAAPAPAAATADGVVTNGIMEEFTCPICQELIVAAYSLNPCGHNFCGACLASWLVTKQECPNCRDRCTAPPVKSHAVDNIIALTAKGLDDSDRKVYEDRKKDWEKMKATLEPKLKDPTKYAGSSGAGNAYGAAAARARVGMVPGVMSGFPGMPGMDYLLQGMIPAQMQMEQYRNAERQRAAQAAAIAADRARAVQALSGEQRFRCQYASGAVRCKGCRSNTSTNELILGMRTVRSRSARNATDYEWYHFRCFPQAGFRNARVVGFENMRNISPADASRIRERLVL